MKLKDKVAMVAGGGQGIGEGIALCLAEEGAEVAIADISAEQAREVAEKAETLGRKALAIAADLTMKTKPNGQFRKPWKHSAGSIF